jgi:hypothetical protein
LQRPERGIRHFVEVFKGSEGRGPGCIFVVRTADATREAGCGALAADATGPFSLPLMSGLALAVAAPPITKAEASVAAAIDSRIFFTDGIEVASFGGPSVG